MKHFVGRCLLGLFIAVVFALCAFNLHAADSPSLSSATAAFDTTTNDKDHDTYLDVVVKTKDDTDIADKTGIGGHWNDHSHNEVALNRHGTIQRDQMDGSQICLTIHPNGNDKWEFNYSLKLKWSDGSVTDKHWDGKVLTQDNAELCDAIF